MREVTAKQCLVANFLCALCELSRLRPDAMLLFAKHVREEISIVKVCCCFLKFVLLCWFDTKMNDGYMTQVSTTHI